MAKEIGKVHIPTRTQVFDKSLCYASRFMTHAVEERGRLESL